MLGEEDNSDYRASKEDFWEEQDNMLGKLKMSLKAGTHTRTAKLKRQIHPQVLQAYIQMHQERMAHRQQPAQPHQPPTPTPPPEPPPAPPQPWSPGSRGEQLVLLDGLEEVIMVGYPYKYLEELLSKLTPESHWILRTSSWRLEVEDFIKKQWARLPCPPGGPWLPRKWKPKPIISREA